MHCQSLIYWVCMRPTFNQSKTTGTILFSWFPSSYRLLWNYSVYRLLRNGRLQLKSTIARFAETSVIQDCDFKSPIAPDSSWNWRVKHRWPTFSFREKHFFEWNHRTTFNDTLNLSENSVFWPTSEHQISVMARHIALKFSDHTLSPSNTQSVSRIFKSLHSHWDIAVQNIRLFSDFRITTKNSIKFFWDH